MRSATGGGQRAWRCPTAVFALGVNGWLVILRHAIEDHVLITVLTTTPFRTTVGW